MEHNSTAGWLLLKSPPVSFIPLLKHANHLYISVELLFIVFQFIISVESKNNQINDKLLEMNKDFKATERKLTEVEKSLTTLPEKEEFMKPTRTAKERSSAVDNSASTNNKYAELQDDSDDEVIFKGSEPGKSNYESTRAAEKSLEKDTLEKSANTSKNINISENVLNADESEKPKTYTRGNMVYLVGDSIAGQVNQVMLGKATKTFVKKLRAPKIDDLQPLTDQVKETDHNLYWNQ